MLLVETLVAKSPPLRLTADGVLLVGRTRVPLDSVVYAFEDGETPEEIVSSFDTLNLADVYAVISYYLENRTEVKAYLERREKHAQEVRRLVEACSPRTDIRERLLARQRQREQE